jgi:hypothetical protein
MRESLVRDRTKTANQMHGFLLEFGISLPKRLAIMKRLSTVLAEHDLPARLTALLQRLHEHFCYLDEQIKALDKELAGQLADDDLGRRLLSIPCVGPITASLLAVEMGDGKQYGCSRDFAASVGLVPRQYSTGGKTNLLGISKRGDKNLRRSLVQCARVYMQRLEYQHGALAEWVRTLLSRRHSNVVACALANKLARIAWTTTAHHTEFEAGSHHGARHAPDKRRIDLGKATTSPANQYCRNEGDHRFFRVSLDVATCIINTPTCNQRVFRPVLIASIRPVTRYLAPAGLPASNHGR